MDSESASIAHTYDAVNRRTQTTYTAAGSVVSGSLRSDPYYVYDEAGNLVAMGDLWGLHRQGFDGLNRPVRHVYPSGHVVYFEYTVRSKRSGIVYPGSSGRAAAVYDPLQRQTRIQAPSGATAYFTYDAVSNQTERLLGNGVRHQMTYDGAERISRWRASNKNGAALTYFDYTRDTKGLITKAVRESVHTVYYRYDENDRLVAEIWATTGASPSEVYGYRYAYDLAGNRIRERVNEASVYYFYDQGNRLTVSGLTAVYGTPSYYVYDKNGSLTDEIEPSGTTKYAYNAPGLVARIRWRDASSAYFYYNGGLQRYAVVSAGTATYFLWDGPNLLQERNADGSVKEEHTNAQTSIAGIGQMVETYRQAESAPDQKIYPVRDARGSIHKWLKSDGTTVLASREHDAFGRIIPGSAVGTWPSKVGYQLSKIVPRRSN